MRIRLLVAILAAGTLGLVGCGDETASASSTPSSQAPLDPKVAEASAQVVTAYNALFEQDTIDPSNPMGSGTASLQQANSTLRASWSADPSDSRVAFGLAVTTLALRMNEMAATLQRASDNGLPIGGDEVATRTTPMDIEESIAVAARVLASPAKAPLVHELQDTLEQRLMPVLDETIELLGVSWNDPTFEFHVALNPVEFPDDTLIIDRSDVGFALSILQAIRAQVRWIISYNADVDQNGSYAWLDTLRNVDDIAVLSSEQQSALQHVESLISNTSSFLAVRTGKEATLASVPAELQAALRRMREAASLAYELKRDRDNHISTIVTPAARDSFLRVVDTGIAWLSGPRQVELYRKVVCKDTGWYSDVYEGQAYGGSYSSTQTRVDVLAAFSGGCSAHEYDEVQSYEWGTYESHSRSYTLSSRSQFAYMDLSKLLSLRDLKVFLPRFQWNATSTWKAEGPISFLDPSNAPVTLRAFGEVADAQGFDGVKSTLTWADPTFGGVFPSHKSSADVLEYFRAAIDDDASAATVAARGPLALF